MHKNNEKLKHNFLSCTCEELFPSDLEFFLFFPLLEKSPKKGHLGPKADKLIVAAFAAKGLNWVGGGLGSVFSFFMNDLPESGTTPSFPWKSLNAILKLGPSSKIGPFPPRT